MTKETIPLAAVKAYVQSVKFEIETLKEIRGEIKSTVKRLNKSLLSLEEEIDGVNGLDEALAGIRTMGDLEE